MIAISTQEMKAIDQYAINEIGIPSIVLMENAAEAFVGELLKEPDINDASVVIFCGLGNNGGDGFAIARKLMQKKINVDVVIIGNQNKIKGDARANLNILNHIDLKPYSITTDEELKNLFGNLPENTVFIDAIFGIGCEKDIEGIYFSVIEKINYSGIKTYAVDMPSGINAQNGRIMGIALKAYKTITFCLPKIGLFLYPGASFTGDVVVVDIGIPDMAWINKTYTYEIIDATYKNLLPIRQSFSHKGTFGKVLIVAGSKNMMGAAFLSAKAAYRSGCGIVKILTEAGNESALFSALPEAIVETYHRDHNFNEQQIINAIEWSDAILIGPGMTDDFYTEKILSIVLTHNNKKTVIDADGLNVLSRHFKLLSNNHSNIIVTPHIGEMSRLTGYSKEAILDNSVEFCLAFSQKHEIITVLKSARTVIAAEDQIFINTLGNSGMATAGSGDVLSGIIVSLLAQTGKILKSAVLGVYIHSQAGDHIKEQIGEAALMANDLIEGISTVMR